MTKEELKEKFAKQQRIIEDANKQIYADIMEYIKGLPFKMGDKVRCKMSGIGFIVDIYPKKHGDSYTGDILVTLKPANKDGSPSKRRNERWAYYCDIIEKVD